MNLVTVKAADLREESEPYIWIKVSYDPEAVEEFDTRDESFSVWEAAWGRRVKVPEGVLYLEWHSYGNGTTTTTRCALRDC